MRSLKIEFLKKYNDFLTEKDIEKLINKRVEELSFDTADFNKFSEQDYIEPYGGLQFYSTFDEYQERKNNVAKNWNWKNRKIFKILP